MVNYNTVIFIIPSTAKMCDLLALAILTLPSKLIILRRDSALNLLILLNKFLTFFAPIFPQ